MKTLTWVIAGLLVSGTAMAFGEAGRWSSGWGQGVSEYTVVDAKQNALYIACGSDPATMTLTLGGKQYGYGSQVGFSLIIDGKQIDAPYETESRLGSGNFRYAWNAIRKAKTLQAKTDNGKLISLPLAGAAKVLPASKAKDFPCVMSW